MTEDPLHAYLELPGRPSDEEAIQMFERILGSSQVTDAYLVMLARKRGARFLTFDQKIRALGSNEAQIEVLTG